MKLDITLCISPGCHAVEFSKEKVLDKCTDTRQCVDVEIETPRKTAIDAFLDSSYVRFGSTKYCMFEEFKRSFKAFELEHGVKAKHHVKFYTEAFAQHGLTFLHDNPKPIILGIELVRTEFLPIEKECTESEDETSEPFRNKMTSPMNSADAFLRSSDVILDPTKHCPFDDFKCALKVFENQNGYKGAKHTPDFFRGPFSKFKLYRVRDQMEYRGRSLKREYVIGVDLVERDDFHSLG